MEGGTQLLGADKKDTIVLELVQLFGGGQMGI